MWSQKSLLMKTDIEASDGPLPDHANKPAEKKTLQEFRYFRAQQLWINIHHFMIKCNSHNTFVHFHQTAGKFDSCYGFLL